MRFWMIRSVLAGLWRTLATGAAAGAWALAATPALAQTPTLGPAIPILPPLPPAAPTLPAPAVPSVPALSLSAASTPLPNTGSVVVEPLPPPGASGQDTTPGNSTGALLPNEAAVRKIVGDYLKEREEQGKKEPKAVEVGSDLSMTGLWDNGLIFVTPNKDWRIHVGGRLQFEPVFWKQPAFLKGTAPGNGGIPDSGARAGVGVLDDGMFFRRVRLRTDGVGYELIEYTIEVNFEQLNFITYDSMWFGFKDLPILGTVRFGQQKVPQGMEMIGSDYHLTFLERSSLSDAFWTLFAPGIQVANTFADQHVTFQTMFHRIQPTGFFTSDFGDGDYAETTRLTWTPIYAAEGACVLHVGGSYQWRHGDLGRTIQPGGTGNTFADTQNVVRFRARPEQRDAIGIGNIGSGVLGGDVARFVDTGFLRASNIHTLSPEFLLIDGPFSVQAEGAWAYAEDTRTIYPTVGGTAQRANNVPRGTPMFWGGYVEASYFLTGEHRGYDRRFGVFDRPRVRENFFLVRGDDGLLHYGWGAWQVAYRVSYLDLNDNGINGGQLLQHTFGLNWYFNDNTKVQMQYININRNVAAPANSGTVHGLGMLFQWYF